MEWHLDFQEQVQPRSPGAPTTSPATCDQPIVNAEPATGNRIAHGPQSVTGSCHRELCRKRFLLPPRPNAHARTSSSTPSHGTTFRRSWRGSSTRMKRLALNCSSFWMHIFVRAERWAARHVEDPGFRRVEARFGVSLTDANCGPTHFPYRTRTTSADL